MDFEEHRKKLTAAKDTATAEERQKERAKNTYATKIADDLKAWAKTGLVGASVEVGGDTAVLQVDARTITIKVIEPRSKDCFVELIVGGNVQKKTGTRTEEQLMTTVLQYLDLV